MKRLVSVALVVISLGWAAALGGPEDLYVQIFDLIEQADNAGKSGQRAEALAKYEQALKQLREFQAAHPAWHENVVSYRLNYLAGKINSLKQPAPLTTAPPPMVAGATSSPPASAGAPDAAEAREQMAAMQQHIKQLQTERLLLEAKLREALSVSQGAVDPRDLARAEEKARSLEKENDLLRVTLEQEKQKAARLIEPAKLKELEEALELTKRQMARQAEQTAALTAEKEALARQVRQERDKTAAMANPETLRAVEQALAEANARLARQEEASAALNKEKELLLAKLQQEREASRQRQDDVRSEAAQRLAEVTKLAESLQSEKLALQKQLETEKGRAAQMVEASALEAARAALAEANRKLDAQTVETAAARREKEILEKSLAQANQRLEEQSATARSLLGETETLQKRLREELAKSAKLADPAELEKIRRELAQTNEKLARQNRLTESLTREKESLQASLKAREPDNALIKSLTEENAGMKKELADLRARNEALEPKLAESQRQLESAQKELEAMKMSYEALQMEKKLLENRAKIQAETSVPGPDPRLIEAEKKLAEAGQAIKATEVQMAALQSEKGILEKAKSDLQTKLEQAREAADEQRRQDRERMAQLERELVQAKALNASREARIKEVEAERKKLEDRLAALASERAKITVRTESETQRIAELSVERDVLRKGLREAERELADLRGRLAGGKTGELEQKLSTMREKARTRESPPPVLSPDDLALLKAPEVRFAGREPALSSKPIRDVPENIRDLIFAAQVEAGAGRLAEAEAKYQAVSRSPRLRVYALYKLAGLQMDRRDFAAAERLIREGLKGDADHSGLLYQLGILCYQQGRVTEAINALSRSVKSNRESPDSLSYLGFVLGRQGALREAETAFRKAVKMEAETKSAHLGLAWVYSHQQPPLLELARWHYRQAMVHGQAPDPEMERRLARAAAVN